MSSSVNKIHYYETKMKIRFFIDIEINTGLKIKFPIIQLSGKILIPETEINKCNLEESLTTFGNEYASKI